MAFAFNLGIALYSLYLAVEIADDGYPGPGLLVFILFILNLFCCFIDVELLIEVVTKIN